MAVRDFFSNLNESLFANFQNLYSRRSSPITSGHDPMRPDDTVGVNIRD
jgi:hypothetical protein